MNGLRGLARRIVRRLRKGSLTGHVDRMDGRVIRGWAVDPADRQTPTVVTVLLDGVFLTEVTADSPRRDVMQAGLGPITCGFEIPVPLAVNDGRAHRLEVRRGIDGPILRGGTFDIKEGRRPAQPTGPVEGLAMFDARLVAIRGWAANALDVLLSFDAGETITVPLTDVIPGFGPDGARGFVYRIPPELRDGQQHLAHVVAGGQTLDGAPVGFSVTAGRPILDVIGVEPTALDFHVRREGRKLASADVFGDIDGVPIQPTDKAGHLRLEIPPGARSLAINDADGSPFARFEMTTAGLRERDDIPDLAALDAAVLAASRDAFETFVSDPESAFDPAWYVWSQPGLPLDLAPEDALEHYRTEGARAGASPHPGFDERRARALHPVIAEAVKAGTLPCAFAFELVKGFGTLGSVPDAAPPMAPSPLISADLPQPTHALRPDQSIYAAWVARLVLSARQRATLVSDEDALRRDIQARPLPGPLPLVSIIMPSWNRAFTIGEAIQSVLEQSYPNWELIVSDDASEDRTVDVVRGFDDPRIRYMKFLKSNGAGARNKGLRHARGDIIAYLDSDNIWHPQFLDLMVRELVHRPGTTIAFSAYLDTEIVGAKVELRDISRPLFRPIRLSSKNFMDLNTIVHWRRVYDWMGGFDDVLPRLQDWDLALRYTSIFRPHAVNRIGVFYRRNMAWGQVTHVHHGSGAQDIVGEKTRRRLEDAHETLGIFWPERPRITILGGMDRGADTLARGLAERVASFADVDLLTVTGDTAVPLALWADPVMFGEALAPILSGRLVIDARADRADWLAAVPSIDPARCLQLATASGRVALTGLTPANREQDLGCVPLPSAIKQADDAPALLITGPTDKAMRRQVKAAAAAARFDLLVCERDEIWYVLSNGTRRSLSSEEGIAQAEHLSTASTLRATSRLSPLQLSLLAACQAAGVPISVPADPAPHSETGLGAEWLAAKAAYPAQKPEADWLIEKMGKLLRDQSARDRLIERGRLAHAITLHSDLVRQRLADTVHAVQFGANGP
ncbi:MAG: glycosyltransferase [Jannaschia sp.]